MMTMISRGLFLLAWCVITPTLAHAASFYAGGLTGLMQQPTSQYYHLIFGAEAGLDTWQERFNMKGIFLQRPDFESAGYRDSEQGVFGFLGTTMIGSKLFSLKTYVGGGNFSGATKKLHAAGDEESVIRYSISGPALAVELGGQFAHVDWKISHINFIGYRGQEQLAGLVVWPYLVYAASLSVRLGG